MKVWTALNWKERRKKSPTLSRHPLSCCPHRTGECQHPAEPGGWIPLHTSHHEVQGTHTFVLYVGAYVWLLLEIQCCVCFSMPRDVQQFFRCVFVMRWLHSIGDKSCLCSKEKVQINLSYFISADFPPCSYDHRALGRLWPHLASVPLLCLKLFPNLSEHPRQWLAPNQWHHLWGTLLWHRTLHEWRGKGYRDICSSKEVCYRKSSERFLFVTLVCVFQI